MGTNDSGQAVQSGDLLEISFNLGKEALEEYKKALTEPMTKKEEFDWRRGFEKGFIFGVCGMAMKERISNNRLTVSPDAKREVNTSGGIVRHD